MKSYITKKVILFFALLLPSLLFAADPSLPSPPDPGGAAANGDVISLLLAYGKRFVFIGGVVLLSYGVFVVSSGGIKKFMDFNKGRDDLSIVFTTVAVGAGLLMVVWYLGSMAAKWWN